MILGIDSSITHTGLAAIFGYEKVEKDVKNKLKTIATKKQGSQRLLETEMALETFINETANETGYTPELVVLEGYGYNPVIMVGQKFGNGGRPMIIGKPFELGEIGGIIKIYFLKRNIKLITIAPTKLKKWITGVGKGSSKSDIKLKAYKKWGLEADDHSLEAYGLANLGYALYKIENKISTIDAFDKKEKEVLKDLIKEMEAAKQ